MKRKEAILGTCGMKLMTISVANHHVAKQQTIGLG
jgi:hypothetical protein